MSVVYGQAECDRMFLLGSSFGFGNLITQHIIKQKHKDKKQNSRALEYLSPAIYSFVYCINTFKTVSAVVNTVKSSYINSITM